MAQSADAAPWAPVYHRLLLDLRDDIGSGKRRPSERLPSEVALANRYGISRSSVRQGLAALARDGLIERVTGRGTFVARPAQRSAAAPRRITAVVNHLADPLSARILAGVSTVAARNGLDVVLGCTWNDPRMEEETLHRAQARGDDGVILFPTDVRLVREPVQALKAAGMPIVLVDRALPGLGLDLVRAAHQDGAASIVTHLLAKGHRDVAFLTTDHLSTPSVAERLQGYRQALAAAGLPFRWQRVWLVPHVEQPTDETEPDAPDQAAILALLGEPDRPSAVFAVNDYLAASLLTAAAEALLSVPGDLTVAGFDGLQPFVAGRRLTTVRQPAEAIGARSVGLLLDRIAGRAPPTPVICSLPVELRPGETAGPFRARASSAHV